MKRGLMVVMIWVCMVGSAHAQGKPDLDKDQVFDVHTTMRWGIITDQVEACKCFGLYFKAKAFKFPPPASVQEILKDYNLKTSTGRPVRLNVKTGGSVMLIFYADTPITRLDARALAKPVMKALLEVKYPEQKLKVQLSKMEKGR